MGKKAATRDVRVPKVKCCVSDERCGRCPIRLLAEGNMPDGYSVKKRRVVRCEPVPNTKKQSGKDAKKTAKKSAKKVAKLADRKVTKAELEKAVKRTRRQRRKTASVA